MNSVNQEYVVVVHSSNVFPVVFMNDQKVATKDYELVACDAVV